ncbi:MAG TPA: DNA-3-methyladenine glycosylase [Candidatus Limnocylindrales bacterium]
MNDRIAAGEPLPREALAADSLEAARRLIGARLVRDDEHGPRVGRIVELEAYIGTDDQASHARFGRTGRNSVMFGPPGFAYVYLVYGMYDCLNLVAEPEGRPAALLVRAVEPLAGVERMRRARLDWIAERYARQAPERQAHARRRVADMPVRALASGPGLVCAAFSVVRADDGLDLCDVASPLRLEAAPPGEPPLRVASGPRVGIGYAAEPWRSKPWRFWAEGNRAVSAGAGEKRK